MDADFYRKIILKNCRIKEDWVKVVKKGVINKMEPRIFGIMNLCTVSFCEGQSFTLKI